MPRVVNDPLVDQDIELMASTARIPRQLVIHSRGPSNLVSRFESPSTLAQALREARFYSNLPTRIGVTLHPLEENIRNILERFGRTPTSIREFKDPDSDETQIIVTVPIDPDVEDPFEELDKLHAEISRFDRTLAARIIILPTDPTE